MLLEPLPGLPKLQCAVLLLHEFHCRPDEILACRDELQSGDIGLQRGVRERGAIYEHIVGGEALFVFAKPKSARRVCLGVDVDQEAGQILKSKSGG